MCFFLNLNSTQNITILSKYIIHDTPANTLFSLRYGERRSNVKRLLSIVLGRGELLAESNERRAWGSSWGALR